MSTFSFATAFILTPVLLAAAQGPLRERTEPFAYYQDGHGGHAKRHIFTIDLGGGVTMDFVRVPAGKFQMGSPLGQTARQPDEDQHPVEITSPFFLGKYEVTRGQFAAFVKETGYRTESETDGAWGYNATAGKIEGRSRTYSWRNTGFPQTGNHPVVNVTWNDADAFCRWLAKKIGRPVRLPTEAEWEYAARAGSSSPYYSGDDPAALVKAGNMADATTKKQFADWEDTLPQADGFVFSAPAGQFLANKFGLHDMLGNVWEWCQDWYGPYSELNSKDPVRDTPLPSIPGRVMRGGGWGKRTPRNPPATRRVAGAPGSRDIDLGFRVAVELEPRSQPSRPRP
jgi:formylglycine-generating enzyme required for sulfatase activity